MTPYTRAQKRLEFTKRTKQYRIECPGCVVYVTDDGDRTTLDVSVDGARFAGQSSRLSITNYNPGTGLRAEVVVSKS